MLIKKCLLKNEVYWYGTYGKIFSKGKWRQNIGNVKA